MGRIEVFYSNEWGTVCDDFFSTTDGNVVCQMLNFTKGALCIASRFNSFGQGTGKGELAILILKNIIFLQKFIFKILSNLAECVVFNPFLSLLDNFPQ